MEGAPIGAPPPFALFSVRSSLVIASVSEAIQPEVSHWIASSLSRLAMTAVCLVLAQLGREGAPRERLVIASASEAVQRFVSEAGFPLTRE
jgi:hypothetical protein